jgi:hypothetical protein
MLIFYLLIVLSLQCYFYKQVLLRNKFQKAYVSSDNTDIYEDTMRKYFTFKPTDVLANTPGHLKCTKYCGSGKPDCLIECLGKDFRVWHYFYYSAICSEDELEKSFYLRMDEYDVITNDDINTLSIDINLENSLSLTITLIQGVLL